MLKMRRCSDTIVKGSYQCFKIIRLRITDPGQFQNTTLKDMIGRKKEKKKTQQD